MTMTSSVVYVPLSCNDSINTIVKQPRRIVPCGQGNTQLQYYLPSEWRPPEYCALF